MAESGRIEIPDFAADLMKRLENHGFEAYVVGGCVRDSLLGLVPHDWDLTTNATPMEMKAAFAALPVIETGAQHGTLTVLNKGEAVEVTAYRTEGGYSDSRHPDEVRFVRNLAEDLKRRDFTVNALAYHPLRGMVDLFGGQEDLNARCLRTVGGPEERFREDALRMMRALRFAAVYDFWIEPMTAAAIHSLAPLLRQISAERISAELLRLLGGEGAAEILRGYSDVIGEVVPELLPMVGFEQKTPYHHLDVWEHTLAAVGAAPPDPVLRLAALLHDIGKPHCMTMDSAGTGHFPGHAEKGAELASGILKRLRFDRKTAARVRELVLRHDDPVELSDRAVKRWLGRMGESGLRDLLAVKRADLAGKPESLQTARLERLDRFEERMQRLIREGACVSVQDLRLSGRELIAAGIPEGYQIGEALQLLTEAVIDGKVKNEKEELLKYYFSRK